MAKVTVPFGAPVEVECEATAFHVDSEGILQREVPRYLESSSGIEGRGLSSPKMISWKVADSFNCTSSEILL